MVARIHARCLVCHLFSSVLNLSRLLFAPISCASGTSWFLRGFAVPWGYLFLYHHRFPSLGTYQLHVLGSGYVSDMFSVVCFRFFHFQLSPNDRISWSIQYVCLPYFLSAPEQFRLLYLFRKKNNDWFCVLQIGPSHIKLNTCSQVTTKTQWVVKWNNIPLFSMDVWVTCLWMYYPEDRTGYQTRRECLSKCCFYLSVSSKEYEIAMWDKVRHPSCNAVLLCEIPGPEYAKQGATGIAAQNTG